MILKRLLFFVALLSRAVLLAQTQTQLESVIAYEVNPRQQDVNFYLQDKDNMNYGSLGNLKNPLEKEDIEVRFAMNGGMYLKDKSPQGLYIEKGITKATLDTLSKGYGNFYLQPNGIFYLTEDKTAVVCQTKEYKLSKEIQFATQSGPMLVINGDIHPAFREGSSNLHFRNAVGLLPNGNLLFAISTEKINFYDLACYFKDQGCRNALYLDGFVSRAYIPSKNWSQLDGNFGVIIGVTAKNN